MNEITETFEALLADHREFHSEFQLDRFVLGAAGDPWAQYQQALRELSVRFDALKAEEIEIDRAQLDIDDAEEAIARGDDPRRAKLDARAAALRLDGLLRRQKDRIREFAHVYARAAALKHQVGPVDEERRKTLDAASWYHRIKTRAALEVAAHGALSLDTIETIYHLPPVDRVFLVETMKDEDGREALLSWLDEAAGRLIDSSEFIPSDEEVRRITGCP